jgi:hypothetical protein
VPKSRQCVSKSKNKKMKKNFFISKKTYTFAKKL